VVDSEGILIGNISVSDIKFSVGDNIHLLSYPVKEFLTINPRRDLVTCLGSETFNQVLEKLANSGVHRVYVVDWEGKGIGVVTCTDIIDTILSLATPCDPTWK